MLDLAEVGYKEPYIWTDVLQGAAPLLEDGGILLLYDSESSSEFASFCRYCFCVTISLHRT